MDVMTLQNKHKGSTIYVIGAGPQLVNINLADISALQHKTSIGLNGVPYLVPTTYFISSYLGMCVMAKAQYERLGMNSTVLFMRYNILSKEVYPKVFTVVKRQFDGYLESSFDESGMPSVRTRGNCALAALHLAFIMGANRIVCVGIEQNNYAHYYHYSPLVRSLALSDIERYMNDASLYVRTVSHGKKERVRLKNQFSVVGPPLDENNEAKITWGKDQLFEKYINILKSRSVDVVTTTPDSVIARSGGEFVPLQQALDTY